jgi:hypothetical protein
MNQASDYPEGHPLFAGKTSTGTYKVYLFAEFEIEDEVGLSASSRTLNPEVALPFDYALGDSVAQTAIDAWKEAGLNPVEMIRVQTGVGVATVPATPGKE